MLRLQSILALVAVAFAMACQSALVGAMPTCAIDQSQAVNRTGSGNCGDHRQQSADIMACVPICTAVEPSATSHFVPVFTEPPTYGAFMEALRDNARGPEPPPPRLA